MHMIVICLYNRHGSIELEPLRKQTNVEIKINDSFFEIKKNIFKLFELSLNRM